MRFLLAMSLLGLAGCAAAPQRPVAAPAGGKAEGEPQRVVAAVIRDVGKVALVNARLRYVVLDFGLSAVPERGQRLHVYRADQRVGELIVTGPRQHQHTVADIVAGEIRAGDSARPD